MLLPSDVARLVLGYLQEEGLSATSRAFIHESPNLKEYAEHSTEDGAIPACVFSLFGKGLTTILNEYVAVKTKESNHQVPAMVSSLWKKLDFTLNQIKSLQNSPALSACQRLRTRAGMANVARQRALTNSPAAGVTCSTVSETISIVSPAQTSHCVITHSTPVSFSIPRSLTPSSAPVLQSQDSGRLLNTSRESLVQVPEHRLNQAPMSPGRRKWKRSGALGGAACSSRPAPAAGVTPEEEPEEMADENFPQLVIQNARDKILGDRSLQEKLAENINKILASEPTPQSSKACTTIVEPDQSIDEILGLQGEIHMSDDAIHDILEQTESDPAFQALFDLFEYNKSRAADGELADGDISSSPEEGDISGSTPTSAVRPCHNVEPGLVQKEASDPASAKANAAERKTRKSAPALKKTILTNNRASRIDTCSANLLVTQEPRQGASRRNEKSPVHPDAAPMDIDQPHAVANVCPASVAAASSSSSSITATLTTLTSMVSETMSLNRPKGAQGTLLPPVQTLSSTGNTKDGSSAPQTAPRSSPSTSGQMSDSGVLLVAAPNAPVLQSPETMKPLPPAAAAKPSSPSVTTSASPVSTSTSTPLSTPSALNKSGDDPSSIVSLNIIISDSQEEEESAPDTALDRAISSISGDKIPTIYLSSPAKPGPAAPGTPRSGPDEAAQAVSGLQRSESVMASPQPQQSYIIQLPFDGAATTAASYILFPPAATEQQSRPTLAKAQAIAPNPFSVTPQRQGFAAGSTLILPSPMKPMVLPLSVMGQNTLGNVQMVSNQLVAVPNAPVVQQPETVKPLPAAAAKPSAPSGSDKNVTNKSLPPLASGQVPQNASSSPRSGHRRILRFDSSAESQTSKVGTSPSSAPTSQPSPRPSPRTKPAILTANKPKRRIETIRCSAPEKSAISPPKQKRGSRKQEHSASSEEPSASDGVDDVSKPAEPRKRSKSTDGKRNHDTGEDGKARAKDSQRSRSLSSDPSQKPASRKEKEAAAEKGKSRESRAEKRTQETTSVTANKENELKGPEQQQQQMASSSAAESTQPKTSKTSALAKQAAEMLQDIQALSSPKELSGQEESGSDGPRVLDSPRTPMRARKSRDAEVTPRPLVAPGGSDPPTCSPASEAGSESSISMAAHTLMILSRAAMARTGTPLKNSLRQEGAGSGGERSPSTAAGKNTKKRKQPSPTSSPPAKRESKRTPSKKKERKKLMECFPQDLDVDKFLSSLHYDE